MASRRTTSSAGRARAVAPRRTPIEESPATSFTGVASGGLGTAANLEDTQLWSLEDLGVPEPEIAPEPDLPPAPSPAPARAPRVGPPQGLVAASGLVAGLPTANEQPNVLEPVRAPRVAAHRGRPRTGVLAVAIASVLAIAALLALRDGLPGGATMGADDAASAFPSAPAISTAAPAPTAAPDAGGGGGKGNGKGGGKNKN